MKMKDLKPGSIYVTQGSGYVYLAVEDTHTDIPSVVALTGISAMNVYMEPMRPYIADEDEPEAEYIMVADVREALHVIEQAVRSGTARLWSA